MSRKLLIECLPFSVEPSMVNESIRKNNGRLIVSGVLQRANAKNQNGRVYPKPILEREVERYMKNEVAQRRALGELDHPEDSVVNLKNVSHNVLECKWKGDDLVGVVEVLDTPAGRILKELFRAGITLGISSRGVGSVQTVSEGGEEVLEVQPDFELIAFDFVSNPSTHGAFMRPMNEGKQLVGSKNSTEYTFDRIIHDIICTLSGECCI